MTRERLLTRRWNNILALALGLPSLIFVAVAFATSIWFETAGFIGITIVGVLY